MGWGGVGLGWGGVGVGSGVDFGTPSRHISHPCAHRQQQRLSGNHHLCLLSQIGSKLMRLLGKAAVGKSMDGVKRQAIRSSPPLIPWPIELPGRGQLDLPASSSVAAGAAAAETMKHGDRLFQHLLLENGCEATETEELCEMVLYHSFAKSQVERVQRDMEEENTRMQGEGPNEVAVGGQG